MFRSKLHFWLLIFSMIVATVPVPARQTSTRAKGCPAAPTRPAGVYLRPSEPARQGNYEFLEKFNPKTYQRKDYVIGPGYEKPSLFYTHGREIGPSMSHHGRLVLINDYAATKLCKVMVSDPKAHRWWDISSRAVDAYRRSVRPDPRLSILPQGFGFSPDDHEVLLGMDLVSVSIARRADAARLRKTYVPAWYVVDSSSGRVLQTYRSAQPPPCWWTH